jgi:hypothetical protein
MGMVEWPEDSLEKPAAQQTQVGAMTCSFGKRRERLVEEGFYDLARSCG